MAEGLLLTLNSRPQTYYRASDCQYRGSDPSGTSPTSAFSSRGLDRAGSPTAASAAFSRDTRTSRSDWEESHRTGSRGGSPRRNESLLRSYLSFPSIPQIEAPSARKKRVVPQMKIEDSESDDYPAFTDWRSRTVVRNPSHRAREEYSTSAPQPYSASPRYSNVPVADLVAPSESPRRKMPSSNADGFSRILDSMEPSL